ncbi:MAG: hypothetical protein GX579_02640 [Chloroflexi bacterium]|nr:hypothetical protein [Chloroflexota bacterium]
MRNLAEIKLNEGGKPVVRPAPTASETKLMEQELGVELPRDYVNFLIFSNGGHPEADTFYVTIEGAVQDWAINRFFHLEPGQPTTEELTYNLREFRAEVADGLLPIADNGGGDR